MTDFFELTRKMRDQAEKHGYAFVMKGHWVLSRASDKALIWPHIDGYISAFERQGMYVKHKKYLNFERALSRTFGGDNE